MDSAIKAAILLRDQSTCIACGRRARLKIHHILSPRLGGSDDPQNLVTLCGSCQMLVSPIPIAILRQYFKLGERELLKRKAKVEIAVHGWVLGGHPRTPPTTSLGKPLGSEKQQGSMVQRRVFNKRGRSRQGKAWTPEEGAALVADFEAHRSISTMAARRGRGIFAVHVRLHKLGLGEVAHPSVDELP